MNARTSEFNDSNGSLVGNLVGPIIGPFPVGKWVTDQCSALAGCAREKCCQIGHVCVPEMCGIRLMTVKRFSRAAQLVNSAGVLIFGVRHLTRTEF